MRTRVRSSSPSSRSRRRRSRTRSQRRQSRRVRSRRRDLSTSSRNSSSPSRERPSNQRPPRTPGLSPRQVSPLLQPVPRVRQFNAECNNSTIPMTPHTFLNAANFHDTDRFFFDEYGNDMSVLQKVCGRLPIRLDLGASAFDICEEFPSHDIVQLAAGQGLERLFPKDSPPLTMYEICARVGTDNHLVELRQEANARLCKLVFSDHVKVRLESFRREMQQLFRAGAETHRQHLAMLSCAPPFPLEDTPVAAKRARVEGWPLTSGTPLHWICRAALKIPFTVGCHYEEAAQWLCAQAPMSMLLEDDEGLTPLEVLVAGWEASQTLTSTILERSKFERWEDVNRMELSSGKSGLMKLLIALAEGFPLCVSQFPLRAMVFLLSGTGKRTFPYKAPPRVVSGGCESSGLMVAAQRARELLMSGEAAIAGAAVEGLDALLGCASKELVDSILVPFTLTDKMIVVADQLRDLARANARRQVLDALADTSKKEPVAADLREAQARLAAAEAQHRAAISSRESRIEALEGELASSQRRLEESESRLRSVNVSPPNLGTTNVGSSTLPAHLCPEPEKQCPLGTGNQHAKSGLDQIGCTPEEALIAQLRRRRLVDDALRDAPAAVREGVMGLSSSLCAAVERLASDLYESECHFIYELVQNAEDAHARSRADESSPPHLRLKLGSSENFPAYFMSDNNEAGFTETDILSLCDISASSKRRAASGSGNAIGCKGIGFKSVFTVSDCPHVLSHGFTFTFNVSGPLGKLGYVTPTWLSPQELARLPVEVRAAHAAGRTVLFLPLRHPSFSVSIEREAEELATRGRATLLFLKRLSCIELVPLCGPQRKLFSRAHGGCAAGDDVSHMAVVVENIGATPHNDEAPVEEYRYILHRHQVAIGSGVSGELVLAFPQHSSAATTGEDVVQASGCESLHCALPVRAVGFGFAIHCDRFDLTANRSDLHRGSQSNRAIRDALPGAFAASCTAVAEVAAHAFKFLGDPVADPFWHVAREAIVEKLACVACVATSAGPKRPTEVLLRGNGSLRRAADIFPEQLVLESCGRALCDAVDASQERLLQRLGAETFGPSHLYACLSYATGSWPSGWIASTWSQAGSAKTLATLYACLASVVFGDHQSVGLETCTSTDALDAALGLTELYLFPLAGGGRARLVDGPVYRGPCEELSSSWQQELAKAGMMRFLPVELTAELDTSSTKLFKALGVVPAQPGTVARAALQAHLCMLPSQSSPLEDSQIRWAPLALLRDMWLQHHNAGSLFIALQEALLSLGIDIRGKSSKHILRDVVMVPGRCASQCTNFCFPSTLRCTTLLGVAGYLAHDIVARIESFLGLPRETSSEVIVPIDALPNCFSVATIADDPTGAWLDALSWEAFLVDCLGVQPLCPADPRQPRVPPEILLGLGGKLGDRGAERRWRMLLDESLVPQPVFDYVCSRLSDVADAAWIGRAPTRGDLHINELFLLQTFQSLVGAALDGQYLDLPELAVSTDRSASLRHQLDCIGIRCVADLPGLVAVLLTLLKKPCRDVGAFARVYIAIWGLEVRTYPQGKLGADRVAGSGHGSSQDTENILKRSVFHPDFPKPLSAAQCVWSPPASPLLARCTAQVPLRDVYASFGEVQLESYFAARGVSPVPSTASAYLGMLGCLLEAAEDLGRQWARSVSVESMRIQLGRPGVAPLPADEFLSEVWAALLAVYKGMSALVGEERLALRPFNPSQTLVIVPLRCPTGGPPTENTMRPVAAFHSGALFQRLAVGEAYWEVSPELAHSRAAEWALSTFFPAELRDVFVESFGVQPVVDRASLRAILQMRAAGGSSNARRTGSHNMWRSDPITRRTEASSVLNRRGAVNEMGLPDDLGAELLAEGISSTVGNACGVASAAAAAALDSLQRHSSRHRSRSHSDGPESADSLVAPALPARSVRCPATRARKLTRCDTIRALSRSGRYLGELTMYVSDDRRGIDVHAQPGVSTLATTLLRLCDVFRVPYASVAIVVGEPGEDGAECGHTSESGWPLLFSSGLRTPADAEMDASFWFGEFCHALAHRGAGAGHDAHHARVMQELFADHHSRFLSIFYGVQLRDRS